MGLRKDIEAGGFGFNRNECSFCGSPDWTGYWLHRGLVEVCPQCARDLLPALYADARRTNDWRLAHGLRDLLDFVKGYWRASAATHRHEILRARDASGRHNDGGAV